MPEDYRTFLHYWFWDIPISMKSDAGFYWGVLVVAVVFSIAIKTLYNRSLFYKKNDHGVVIYATYAESLIHRYLITGIVRLISFLLMLVVIYILYAMLI